MTNSTLISAIDVVMGLSKSFIDHGGGTKRLQDCIFNALTSLAILKHEIMALKGGSA